MILIIIMIYMVGETIYYVKIKTIDIFFTKTVTNITFNFYNALSIKYIFMCQ